MGASSCDAMQALVEVEEDVFSADLLQAGCQGGLGDPAKPSNLLVGQALAFKRTTLPSSFEPVDSDHDVPPPFRLLSEGSYPPCFKKSGS
jgi:hypothetical protein